MFSHVSGSVSELKTALPNKRKLLILPVFWRLNLFSKFICQDVIVNPTLQLKAGNLSMMTDR